MYPLTPSRPRSGRRRALPRLAAAIVVASLAVAGCGDEGDNPASPGGGVPSPPASQFTGTFLNASQAGLMSLTIASANLARRLDAPANADTVVTATAVLSPDGGGVINLSGAYDTTTDSLHLAGQGYVFAGRYEATGVPPDIEGEYTGPIGSGAFACLPGGTGSVKVFCGAFRSSSTATTGLWNLVISGATLIGLEAANGGPGAVGFSGVVTGTGVVRALSFSSTGGPALSGSGTWNTSTNLVAGTWTTTGESGTWSGEPCLPGTTGPD